MSIEFAPTPTTRAYKFDLTHHDFANTFLQHSDNLHHAGWRLASTFIWPGQPQFLIAVYQSTAGSVGAIRGQSTEAVSD